ncbi:MAG: dienelactone hydrolase family protein [Dokdonella sp.]
MGTTIHLNTTRMQCISAYVAEPTGKSKGGIVVAQEIFGVNAHIRAVADRFATHGYTTIAPAFFDHLETGVELGYDAEGIERGHNLIGELGFDIAVEDIASAAEAISSAGKIGCVGYCWGGTIAFLAVTRLGFPSVSYYGSRNTQYFSEPLRAPVQFHFGERDASIQAAAIERHRQELPNAEVFAYPADHGFNCDMRASYDAESAQLAEQRSLRFLEQHLGK